jgi:hypothetical protein
MKWIGLLLLIVNATFATGCNTFADAQLQLLQQARLGIELQQQSAAQRGEFVAGYYQLQRNRLDTAFDADVRETDLLSKDWVIEHRKAYAAALDAINHQQNITTASEATAAQNRAAVDVALQRLESLISIQSRLWPSERGK